jgi:hypothetical protein
VAKTPFEQWRELELECDLAAYRVLGASRVLARIFAGNSTADSTLQLIAEYDERRKAADQYEKSEEFKAVKP